MVLTKCMAYCLLLGNAGEWYSIRINVFLQNLLAALAGQRDGFWRNVCPTAGQSSVPASVSSKYMFTSHLLINLAGQRYDFCTNVCLEFKEKMQLHVPSLLVGCRCDIAPGKCVPFILHGLLL